MLKWIACHLLVLVCVALLAAPLMPFTAFADWTEALKAPPAEVLIPAGQFVMGLESASNAVPLHEVALDAFYIDAYEVTNAQFLAFCEDTGAKLPEFWGIDKYRCGPDFPDHPVVGVSHHAASLYARWCGKRLPTEAEWEYAARGGLKGLKYSTGDEADRTLFNFKSGGTEPVGSYPPNGFGLYDMTGNVREWVEDFYRHDYYSVSPSENPTGPETGELRVIRGGGWHSGAGCHNIGDRHALAGGWQDFNVGFRCARDAD